MPVQIGLDDCAAMFPVPGRRAPLPCGVALLLYCLCGCAGGPERISASPLSSEEQQRAVLEIVPLGTPRLESIRRLKDAGFEMTPGTAESVYYCDIWNRQDGQRWHMNVALQFDQTGALYRTRQAQSEVSAVSDPGARSSSGTGRSKSALEQTESAPVSAPAESGGSRSGLRTPFAKP